MSRPRRVYTEEQKKKNNARNYAWRKANPELWNERRRKWAAKNRPQLKKEWYVFGYRRYGITEADYRRMMVEQSGLCKICGKKDDRRLCIDHCHKTGKAADYSVNTATQD